MFCETPASASGAVKEFWWVRQGIGVIGDFGARWASPDGLAAEFHGYRDYVMGW